MYHVRPYAAKGIRVRVGVFEHDALPVHQSLPLYCLHFIFYVNPKRWRSSRVVLLTAAAAARTDSDVWGFPESARRLD